MSISRQHLVSCQLVNKMFLKQTVALRITFFIVIVKFASSEIIRTRNGEIMGSLGKSRSGVFYHRFLRIPYAEPPLGELRFQAPVVKKSWNDILNCTEFGPVCMQVYTTGMNLMSEDCLHLNIFTKNIPSALTHQLKPVIVFIHGGGFKAGSAINYGPEYLMDRDIVVVTLNYRLGVFGFMAVGLPHVPGNSAMKDQALALKWIKMNIESFGGDPNKVTIAGSTSGAHCVTSHMVSPMTKDLFKNVIAMSGAITWQKKLRTNNIDMVTKLAEKVHCKVDNIHEMVKCLTDVSHEMKSYYTLIKFWLK